MKSINKKLLFLITATAIGFQASAESLPLNKSVDISNLGLKQTVFNNKSGSSADLNQVYGINDANRIDGRYIVVLDKDAVTKAMKKSRGMMTVAGFLNDFVSSTNRSSSMEYVRYYDDVLYGVVIETGDQAVVDYFLNDPMVDYVQVDHEVTFEGTQYNPTWGLDRVDQDDLPLDDVFEYPNTASSVNAYVIDSGVNEFHGDFGGRVETNLDFFVEPETGPVGDPPPCCDIPSDGDENGHGTHVIGTIGGSTYGVAKNVKLHSLKMFDEHGVGSTTGLLSALNWVKNNHVAPAVLNMSLGTPPSPALYEMITAVQASGVIMVAAAGNQNANACAHWPAAYTGVISVGSTDILDRRSTFSNKGSCVDVFAPGSGIKSASHLNNSGNRTLSGTSMAAPHVTGAIAQYLQQNPGASFAQVKTAITSTATQGTLTQVGAGSPNLLLNVPALMGVIDEYAPDDFDNISTRGYDDDIAENSVLWPGTTQGADYHNFHDQGDEDWTIVYFNGSGRIFTEAIGNNAATTIEVYRWISADLHPSGDGRFININDEFIDDDMSSGNSQVILHAHEPDVYAVRVRSYNNASGEGTEYKLNMVALEPSNPDQYDNVPLQRAYDDDSEGKSVSWSGPVQIHNFHDAGDEDWTFVYFSGFAKFSTVLYGENADTTLEVFKWISADEHPFISGQFVNVISQPVGQDFSAGSSTVYVNATEPDVYAIRVKSRGNVHGSTTSYALKLEAL